MEELAASYSDRGGIIVGYGDGGLLINTGVLVGRFHLVQKCSYILRS